MLARTALKGCAASVLGLALIASTGCGKCGTAVATMSTDRCPAPAGSFAADLPSNARPGECFAKVYVPPEFKTVTERVCVREASERLEIIPAQYEWVEERVCVREASERLVEIPARYETRQVTIQTDEGHTDWVVNKDCVPPRNAATSDVFCLVKHPPSTQTVSVRCMVEGPKVKKECIPAQYETVRRQKLCKPATTRKVCIPAEYTNVTKRVKVCDGRMVWQRVACEVPAAMEVDHSGQLRPRNLDRDFDRDLDRDYNRGLDRDSNLNRDFEHEEKIEIDRDSDGDVEIKRETNQDID